MQIRFSGQSSPPLSHSSYTPEGDYVGPNIGVKTLNADGDLQVRRPNGIIKVLMTPLDPDADSDDTFNKY